MPCGEISMTEKKIDGFDKYEIEEAAEKADIAKTLRGI